MGFRYSPLTPSPLHAEAENISRFSWDCEPAADTFRIERNLGLAGIQQYGINTSEFANGSQSGWIDVPADQAYLLYRAVYGAYNSTNPYRYVPPKSRDI